MLVFSPVSIFHSCERCSYALSLWHSPFFSHFLPPVYPQNIPWHLSISLAQQALSALSADPYMMGATCALPPFTIINVILKYFLFPSSTYLHSTCPSCHWFLCHMPHLVCLWSKATSPTAFLNTKHLLKVLIVLYSVSLSTRCLAYCNKAEDEKHPAVPASCGFISSEHSPVPGA